MSSSLLFWLALASKMAVTAAFVVLATVTAERAGALVGALVATLPVAAGPAYVFLALDHDAAFIAESALASLAVNAVTAIFALTYAAAAQTRGLALSLAAALTAWAVLAITVRSIEWTLATVLLLNVIVIPACAAIGRRFRDAPMPLVTRRSYDVPLRAAMAAVLVAVVVGLSARVGATVTGVLAVFPIVLTTLMLIPAAKDRRAGNRSGPGEHDSRPRRLRVLPACAASRRGAARLGRRASARARGLDRRQPLDLGGTAARDVGVRVTNGE
jgi:hypothetical protein